MAKVDARTLTQEQQETLRFTAVRMVFEEGYTQREAARIVGVSRTEVVRWCRRYEKGGWDALKAKKRGRRPGEQMALLPWQCATIVNCIKDRTPDQMKLPFVLWTRAAIRDLIAERFGIVFSLSAMSNYLKRWGFTPQKPVRKAYQQNPQAVDKWLKEEYPEIKLRAQKEKGIIFWGDETKVTNEIHAGRSFAPRGRTPEVRESGTKMKINIISALNNRGEVRFMSYGTTMTQKKYIVFLSRLLRSVDSKIFFIADNLKVHHGRKVREWVEKNSDRIELFFIPSYSPELNPDEYLNRDLKKNVHRNRAPRTKVELITNVLSFLKMLQRSPHRVVKYFRASKIVYAA